MGFFFSFSSSILPPVRFFLVLFSVARIGDYTRSGSFHAKDNRSPQENELIMLRKELKRLRMENDILKQAASIMAKR